MYLEDVSIELTRVLYYLRRGIVILADIELVYSTFNIDFCNTLLAWHCSTIAVWITVRLESCIIVSCCCPGVLSPRLLLLCCNPVRR